MPSTYIVDGYNVIFHIIYKDRSFLPLIAHETERNRNLLIDRLATFCNAGEDRVIVVFDGQGSQGEAIAPVPGVSLEIRYAPGHKTADAVIERMVTQSPNRRDWTVVTADNGVRMHCRGSGSLVMSPQNFIHEVREKIKNLDVFMRPATDHTTEPMERVSDRLDEGMMRRLEELKKELDEKG